MRNNLILTMSVLDEPTEVKYVIPQRGIDEIEFYNVFEMDKPGFHVVKRPLVIEEDNNHFTYQSIWLDCYFKDPDDNELLFRFIAGNNYGANSECIACVMEGDSLLLPEFHFSMNDFDLDNLFELRRPIVQLLQIKTKTGKEYILKLINE